jgi:hypothetical protein
MLAVIQKYSERPGNQWDCVNFVGECIEAMTGSNPSSRFDITDETAANALLVQFGGLRAAIESVYGEPYHSSHKDGDVALVTYAGVDCAGVIYHDRVLVRVPSGVTDWPLRAARFIWET